MSEGRLLRVAVVGATGAVGAEVLALLQSRRFPLQEVLPIATERSLGETVELLGHEMPVVTEAVRLEGLDLVLLCAPRGEALAWVRAALEQGVPCIDLSGAAAATDEVPLLDALREPTADALAQPLLASPGGAALAWSRVLGPIDEAAGVRRVVATTLEAASGAGRAGVSALEAETLALFNQQEPPEPEVFEHAVAFDCVPSTGARDPDGRTEAEAAVAGQLARLLGREIPVAVTSLRVPVFAGGGASLAVETERPLAAAECAERLAKAAGVALRADDDPGPTTRETVGEDDVLVGRIRRDPSVATGLLLWLAADPVRLVAANALRLAEARFAREG